MNSTTTIRGIGPGTTNCRYEGGAVPQHRLDAVMGRRAEDDKRRGERAPVRLPREVVLRGIGRAQTNPRPTATAIVASRTHSRTALPDLRMTVRRSRTAGRNLRSAEVPLDTYPLTSEQPPETGGQRPPAFGQVAGGFGMLSPASGDGNRVWDAALSLRTAVRNLRSAVRKSIREENRFRRHPPPPPPREWNRERPARAPPHGGACRVRSCRQQDLNEERREPGGGAGRPVPPGTARAVFGLLRSVPRPTWFRW